MNEPIVCDKCGAHRNRAKPKLCPGPCTPTPWKCPACHADGEEHRVYYQALRADIATSGVINNPVVYVPFSGAATCFRNTKIVDGQQVHLTDGRHRTAISKELEIDCPFVVPATCMACYSQDPQHIVYVAELRVDIAKNGILNPVPPPGIGGRHRRMIAKELGIECPTR